MANAMMGIKKMENYAMSPEVLLKSDGHFKGQNPTNIFSNPSAKSCRYNIHGFVEELPKLPENRFQHACAALPATGVRPSRPSTVTRVSVYCNFPGVCCCRREKGYLQHPFFCAHPPPWGRSLDIPRLPSKTVDSCSGFSCGWQDQAGRWL